MPKRFSSPFHRWPLTLALLLGCLTPLLAQTPGVGVGTTTPHAKAALEVKSTTQGLLPPRMTQAERDAIAPGATAAGLTVYNITTGKLNTWNGTTWAETLTTTEQPYQAPVGTFNFTGSEQTYTVPFGVTQLTVDAAGARGGGAGGPGGRVQTTLTVVPGEVLRLYVGGAGSQAPNGPAGGRYPGGGGYNGGGDGTNSNYGGGGATDIRRGGATPADRIVVAAGGGGQAGSTGTGGSGGGLQGGDGAGTYPGAGGTQTAGGGGSLGVGDGTFFQGGTGSYSGGGGGYYGGGGGSADGWTGGGGGGSSFVTASGSSGTVHTQGYRFGNGYLTLTPVAQYATPAISGVNIINLPAASLTGSIPAASLTSVPAASLTGSIPAASLTSVPAASLTGVVAVANLPALTSSASGTSRTIALGTGNSTTFTVGDNLGTHLATQKLDLAAFPLVGNGGNAGLLISNAGAVGIGSFPAGVADVGLHVRTAEKPAISAAAGVYLSGGAGGNPNLELRGDAGQTPYLDFANSLTTDFASRLLQTSTGLEFQSTGGTTRLFVSGAGRVGVGTTSPRQSLDVADAAVVGTTLAVGIATMPAGRSLNVAGAADVQGALRVGTNAQPGSLEVVTSGGAVASALDQQQNVFNFTAGFTDVWQSFTAGRAGALTKFELAISSPLLSRAAASGTLKVYAGEGISGTLLSQQTITMAYVSGGTFQTYTLPTAVPVQFGEKYTYRLETPVVEVSNINFTVNRYYGGRASRSPGEDLMFRTYVTGAPVATLFTVQEGGPVGIGTAAPTERLDVTGGNIKLSTAGSGLIFPDGSTQLTAVVAGAYIRNGTTAQTGASFNIDGSSTVGGNAAVGGTATIAGAATLGGGATITGNAAVSGRLGIGTTGTPAEKLQIVDGNVRLSSATATTMGVTITNSVGSLNLGLASGGGQYSDLAQAGDAVLRTNGKRLLLAGRDGGTVLISTGATGAEAERLRVTTAGLVGIGTPTPTQRLDVDGGILARANSAISVQGAYLQWNRTGGEGEAWLINQKGGGNANAGIRFGKSDASNAVTEFARFQDNGRFGIGTTNPIAPLHVKGTAGALTQGGGYSFFSPGSGLGVSSVGSGVGKSVAAYFEGGEVWVNAYIVAGALQTTSDGRIKRIVGRSEGAADLALLNRLRITDYTYIDQVNHPGGQVIKKVIAQEVEEVLPAAVSRSFQALPNVYERATKVSFANGQVTVTTAKPHELPAAGGRLRLYTPTNAELNPDVTVVDAHTVRFASPEGYADGLFVYGKYVDDFRSVDYDALTTLNVSATQELARKVAALEAQNAAQQQRADRAEAAVSTFEARLRALEAGTGQARK